MKLYEPIKIRGMELKNRVVMPAIATIAWGLGPEGSTQTVIDFYSKRASGGTGSIIIGALSPSMFIPEEDLVVWLGTNRNTRKAREIRNDPRVTLYYPHPQGAGYVTIRGTARLVDDPQEKAQRWKEEWARYYPEGKASYILIKVKPSRLEVVDYSKGIVGDPATWTSPSVTF